MRRFRFSLLTLLCFVLLLASAITLWWNWEAWIPAYKLNAEGIEYAGFLPGGKLVYLRTAEAIQLFDAPTGRKGHTLPIAKPVEFSFAPDGKYISTWSWSSQNAPRFDPGIWNVENGQWIAFNDFSTAELTKISFSALSSYVVINANGHGVMMRISDMRVIGELTNSDNFTFSPDDKWLAVQKTGASDGIQALSSPAEPQGIAIYSLPEFKRVLWAKYNSGVAHAFSPAGELFALSLDDSTRIYETKTWKPLPAMLGGTAYSINNDGKTLVYWNNAWWLMHSDDAKISATQLGTSLAQIDLLDHSVVTWPPLVSYDTTTGKVRFNRGTLTGKIELTAGKHFVVHTLESGAGFNFIDPDDGIVKGTIRSWRWRHVLSAPVENRPLLSFSDRGTQFMTQPTPASAVVWHWDKQNMPWDMLKRAEPWLTLAAAIALVWSLRSGRGPAKRIEE